MTSKMRRRNGSTVPSGVVLLRWANTMENVLRRGAVPI